MKKTEKRQSTRRCWTGISPFELTGRIEESRLYNHSQFTQKMLKEILDSSGHLLRKIEVDLSLYGKFNPAGVHQNEPEPVPNFYIPEKDIHFYDSDWFISKEEFEAIMELKEDLMVTCAENLPEPKNLAEIAELGASDQNLSTSAFAELLYQLYNQTKVDVLVLLDDYNWCFRPSNFQSFRYSSIKRLNSSIPAEHMSLLRILMKLDGHKIRRGFKVFGTSNQSIPKHYFSPEKINFNSSHAFPLKGITSLNEAFEFVKMSMVTNTYYFEQVGIDAVLQLLMESQGNYSEMMKLMQYPSLRHYDTTYITKKKKNKNISKLRMIYNRIE